MDHYKLFEVTKKCDFSHSAIGMEIVLNYGYTTQWRALFIVLRVFESG